MVKYTILLVLLLLHSLLASNVVINEVCYDPIGADQGYEWIELYNNGDEDINLIGWSIYTAGSQFQEDFEFPSIIIRSGRYILIAEDKVEQAHIYTDLELQNASPVVDGIALVNPDSSYTDTILYGITNENQLHDDINSLGTSYAPDPSQGFSLMRVPNGVDTDIISDDFFACSRPTPGYENSRDIDLCLKEVICIKIADKLKISTVINNKSTWDVDNFECQLNFYRDELLIQSTPLQGIKALNAIDTIIYIDNTVDFSYNLKVEVFHPQETNSVDNLWVTEIINTNITLFINEIMPNPAYNGQEWIELYNPNFLSINSTLISVEDYTGNSINISKPIPPLEYVILCTDSLDFCLSYPDCAPECVIEITSLPTMNNDGDCLVLKSYTIIDSISYSDYAEEGCSFYRINNDIPDMNPYDSSIYASPGEQNYQQHPENEFNVSISCTENITHIVSFIGIIEPIESIFSCVLCNINGDNEVEQFSELITITEDSTIEFTSDIPPKGCYYYFYSFNQESLTKLWIQDTVPTVINEIMFNPLINEPEWIELYSKIPQEHNVTIAISSDSLEVPISNEGFYIITSNLSDVDQLHNQYGLDTVQIYTGLPSLLNSGEMITISSEVSNVTESFHYQSSWSSVKGVSAERTSPHVSPVDSNWCGSIDNSGNTIGRVNSIYREYIPEKDKVKLHPNPFSPYRGETCDIVFTLESPVVEVTCTVYDLQGRKLVTPVKNTQISGNDMINWDGRWRGGKKLIPGSYILLVEINDEGKVSKKQIPFAIGY